MRKVWGQVLLLVMVCALLFGSVGYYLGGRTRGSVYQLSGTPTALVTLPSEESTPAETTPSAPLVNLNTADLEELMTLPGIGEVRAAAILAYREEYGTFQTVEDLLLVSGIGQGLLDQLAEYVTVEDSTEE